MSSSSSVDPVRRRALTFADAAALTPAEAREQFTPFDMKRLKSYADGLLDHHVITDLLPSLATLVFTHRFGAAVKVSAVQSAILLALGLQRKSLESVETELGLPVAQLLSLFAKAIRRLSTALEDTRRLELGADIPVAPIAAPTATAAAQSSMAEMDEELREAGDEVTKRLRDEAVAALDPAK